LAASAKSWSSAGTDKLVLSTMVFASIALMQMAVALQCRDASP